eukprot:11309324-Alexandrium_andersonii.AAC.1
MTQLPMCPPHLQANGARHVRHGELDLLRERGIIVQGAVVLIDGRLDHHIVVGSVSLGALQVGVQ